MFCARVLKFEKSLNALNHAIDAKKGHDDKLRCKQYSENNNLQGLCFWLRPDKSMNKAVFTVARVIFNQ